MLQGSVQSIIPSSQPSGGISQASATLVVGTFVLFTALATLIHTVRHSKRVLAFEREKAADAQTLQMLEARREAIATYASSAAWALGTAEAARLSSKSVSESLESLKAIRATAEGPAAMEKWDKRNEQIMDLYLRSIERKNGAHEKMYENHYRVLMQIPDDAKAVAFTDMNMRLSLLIEGMAQMSDQAVSQHLAIERASLRQWAKDQLVVLNSSVHLSLSQLPSQ